jgi:hypothetical protein
MDRGKRGAIAVVATLLWLGYMAVGIALLNAIAPTVRGEGPFGALAFIGLMGGVVVAGLIMWWASD